MVYHSQFNDAKVNSVCNIPLLPIKSRIKGWNEKRKRKRKKEKEKKEEKEKEK